MSNHHEVMKKRKSPDGFYAYNGKCCNPVKGHIKCLLFFKISNALIKTHVNRLRKLD